MFSVDLDADTLKSIKPYFLGEKEFDQLSDYEKKLLHIFPKLTDNFYLVFDTCKKTLKPDVQQCIIDSVIYGYSYKDLEIKYDAKRNNMYRNETRLRNDIERFMILAEKFNFNFIEPLKYLK